jgi:hypothetical protein
LTAGDLSSADAASAPALPPPAPLRLLVWGSLALAFFPLCFAVHYTIGWAQHRAGRPIEEQRRTLVGVPWFKPPFIAFVDRVRRTIPPDARVLVEVSRVETVKGRARWFLFLNFYAYPIEFYVRAPRSASGTLVDYEGYVRSEFQRLFDAGYSEDRALELLEAEERDIRWRVRFPLTDRFQLDEVEVFHRDDAGWTRVRLEPREAPLLQEGDAPPLSPPVRSTR